MDLDQELRAYLTCQMDICKKEKKDETKQINKILKRMNDEYKTKQFILKKLNWSLVDKKESDVKIRYAWLRMGEFKNSSLSKLPQLAQAAIEVSAEAGILPMFLEMEYKQLKKSLKKFIKIAEKRGV